MLSGMVKNRPVLSKDETSLSRSAKALMNVSRPQRTLPQIHLKVFRFIEKHGGFI